MDAYGKMQLNGSDICIDIYCSCGFEDHYDGNFFYEYTCPSCKQEYTVGNEITLTPTTKDGKHDA